MPIRQSLDALILKHLRDHPQSTAPIIGAACGMAPAEVRSRLAHLNSLRLVTSHQDVHTQSPSRIYRITAEGRRKVQT